MYGGIAASLEGGVGQLVGGWEQHGTCIVGLLQGEKLRYHIDWTLDICSQASAFSFLVPVVLLRA